MTREFKAVKYGLIKVTYKTRQNKVLLACDTVITQTEAEIIQDKIGYNPHGYGLYEFKSNESKTTWNCSTSSD